MNNFWAEEALKDAAVKAAGGIRKVNSNSEAHSRACAIVAHAKGLGPMPKLTPAKKIIADAAVADFRAAVGE